MGKPQTSREKFEKLESIKKAFSKSFFEEQFEPIVRTLHQTCFEEKTTFVLIEDLCTVHRPFEPHY